MPTGTLAWKSPARAILWEFWGRHKLLFMVQGAALLVSFVIVQWHEGFSPSSREIFVPCAYQAGIFALLHTLTCFCYMEIDVRRLQGGIPGHLLLKPISTLRLVALPMCFGGAAVVTVLIAWVALVWRHIGFPTGLLPWFCLAVVSFIWSIQAAAWSFANLAWAAQALLVLLAAGANVLVGSLPALPWQIPVGWRLAMMAALLAGSFSLALAGVRRARQGAWENAGWQPAQAPSAGRCKVRKFRSAFRAQFWLEWRRQGWSLPFFVGVGQLLIILAQLVLQFSFRQQTGADLTTQADEIPVMFNYLLLIPLVCSLMLGGLLVDFSLGQRGNELPLFVAVRPMTNGGFVLAKLAMAALTSGVTWLVTIFMLILWLTLGADVGVVAQLAPVVRAKPMSMALLFLAVWATFAVVTWRNLVSGLWLGLSGQTTFVTGFNWLRFAFYLSVFVLGKKAWERPESRTALLDWLPWILGSALLLKLIFSVAAFRWSLRHKAVTSSVIAWIVTGWLGGGLFLAVAAGRACADLHQWQAWPWAILSGLLLLPLAELALAPAALTWNRHR